MRTTKPSAETARQSAIRKHPFNKELLVYCSGIVSQATSKHSQQLLRALSRYLMSHADDSEVRALRGQLNKFLKFQLRLELLENKLSNRKIRNVTEASLIAIVRKCQGVVLAVQAEVKKLQSNGLPNLEIYKVTLAASNAVLNKCFQVLSAVCAELEKRTTSDETHTRIRARVGNRTQRRLRRHG